MEEFSDVMFKHSAVIEFFTAEKVVPIEIHRRMQAVCGDRFVDAKYSGTLGKALQRWRIEASRFE